MWGSTTNANRGRADTQLPAQFHFVAEIMTAPSPTRNPTSSWLVLQQAAKISPKAMFVGRGFRHDIKPAKKGLQPLTYAANFTSINSPMLYSAQMPEPALHLGSSSFTADGWWGPFYPKNLKSADRLSFYATRFDTVEIDSTFYGCPSVKTVQNWFDKTPANFVFSLKAPNIITHDKLLEDCHADLNEFLETASLLKEKLGPVVFQFPFFDRLKFPTQQDFLKILEPFLSKLPGDKKFAIEIRNKNWLDANFADLLRHHKIALVLQDLSTMPAPHDLERKFDPVTTDWTYIRWLGDRKWIEGVTVKFDKPVIDRTPQLMRWIDFCFKIRHRGVTIYAYANNHYTGFSPHTITQFRQLWKQKGHDPLPEPPLAPAPQPKSDSPDNDHQQPTLFDL